MRVCSIESCTKKAEKRGWCAMHYRRWHVHGDTDHTRPPALTRFFTKVDKDGPIAALRPDLGPCWVWTAGRFEFGYGMFSLHPRTVYAHRWLYEQVVGAVPKGLVLDHFACERPECVNPGHVRPVTERENLLRGRGIGARNLAKTHCIRGHEFTPENTYRFGPDNAYRCCRTCKRAQPKRRELAAHHSPERLA